MGKKKKVDINGTPLQAVTIGKVKDNKYGWVVVLFLFSLFCAIIYFLPDLTRLYNEYMSGGTAPVGNNGGINNTINNTTEPDEGEKDEVSQEETLYTFGTDLSVTVDNLIFTDIRNMNNVLTFNVTNKSQETINLDELELYISVYDKNNEEKLVLNHLAILGEIEPEEMNDYSFDIKEGALYFNIKNISEDEYTYIDLMPDESGNITLTCEKDREKLVYLFVDNKLKLVEHSDIVYKDSADYEDAYNKYNTIVSEYENNSGIKTKLSILDSYLWYKMEVNYNLSGTSIDYKYYFDKDATPRVVNFIMESVLYECS